MGTLIGILIVAVCLLLCIVVLVQNPKGGGLASEFGSANQFGGVRRTADFLEKSTWTLVTALMVLSIVSSTFVFDGKPGAAGETFRDELPEMQQPANFGGGSTDEFED
ncbi:MAG: preprotein translocase subunit SecG [Luteibaculaceae bacterium]